MKKRFTLLLGGCFMLIGMPIASAQTIYNVGHATQPSPLVATAPSDTAICNGSSVFLTGNSTGGTASFTYLWSPSTGLSSTTTDTTTSSATSNQTYAFTVTDARNCSSSDGVTVTINSLPTATVGNTGPYCVGSTITLSSSGGVDYDWTGPNSYVQNNTQNPTITNATVVMGGVYTVTVTNASGCSTTATTTVAVNDCTGLTEIKEVESLNIYPNPNDGNFNVSVAFKNKPNSVMLEFYNMNGVLVLTKNYQKPGTELKENIQLPSVAAGNYFMRITVGKHSLTQTFIIK